MVDTTLVFTSKLNLTSQYITDENDSNFGKIKVTISSLTGICDHVHIYMDDYDNMTSNYHNVLNQNVTTLDTSTDFSVSVDTATSTATITATLTGTTGDINLENGDYITLASTGNVKFDGTYAVSDDDPSTSTFTFTKAVDENDPVVSGPVSESTVLKLIKKHSYLDVNYPGDHRIVAYTAASAHERVSEYSISNLTTS